VHVRQRQVIGMALLSLLAVLGFAVLSAGADDSRRIVTDAGFFARAALTTVVEPAPPVAEATTTTTIAAPAPAPTTTLRRPVTTKPPATTTTTITAPGPAVTTSTTTPAPVVAAAVTTTSTTLPAPTTTTTIDPCRNSTVSTCGPFRFDPQPGADRPMTVAVTVEPAAPIAGQPMVFHITLTDPDGVSYDGTTFNFGNSGIGGSTPETCAKFGPWDPPAIDPSSATQTVNVTHTYFEAGTYTATFLFDAGPFDCVDSVTGRGDRPYASSATGTVTVQVGPET
jgi:hypothetical protein